MLIFREQYMAMVLQDGPEAPGSAQDLSSTLGKLFDFSSCIFAVGTMQIKSEHSCVRENIYQIIDSLAFAGTISYDWLLLFWLGAWIEKKFLCGYSCVLIITDIRVSRGHPVHCSMFSSIPPYILPTWCQRYPPTPVITRRNISRQGKMSQMSPQGRNHPRERPPGLGNSIDTPIPETMFCNHLVY